jgi:hypothetical protein
VTVMMRRRRLRITLSELIDENDWHRLQHDFHYEYTHDEQDTIAAYALSASSFTYNFIQL